ncbi:MAG: hypothetical protein ACRC0G_15910 [Fusobacteriaceae bacterium]
MAIIKTRKKINPFVQTDKRLLEYFSGKFRGHELVERIALYTTVLSLTKDEFLEFTKISENCGLTEERVRELVGEFIFEGIITYEIGGVESESLV